MRHLPKSEILVVDNLFRGCVDSVKGVDNVEFLKADVRSHVMKRIVESFDPDVIIHLAAIHYIPYCNEHPYETFDVNVIGTLNVARLAENRFFLLASSASVYPDLNYPVSEDVEPSPSDVYGKTKLVAEELVKSMCDEAVIARIFNVYGEGDTNPHVIPEILSQVKSGSRVVRLGNLTSVRDFIHVDDTCRALSLLISRRETGVFNIGSGCGFSIEQIVEMISNILGEKIDTVVIPSKIRKNDRPYLVADITKIKKLGWKPRISLYKWLKRVLTT